MKLVVFVVLVAIAGSACARCRYNEGLGQPLAPCSGFLDNFRDINETFAEGMEKLVLRNVSVFVDKTTFPVLPNLVYFSISGSDINVTDGVLGVLMPKLIFFVLNDNKNFTRVTKSFFQASNITWLAFVSNPRMVIEEDSFEFLKNLSWFHLQHQNFEKLPSTLFNNTENLHELTINNCGLTTIDVDAFVNTKNLEILSLNFNKLTHFENGTFRNLGKLKVLELHYNQLKEVDLNQLRDLASLEIAGFPSNVVRSLRVKELLESFPKLQKFEMKKIDLRRNETRILAKELMKRGVHVIGTPHDCHLPFPPFNSCHNFKNVG